MRNFSYALLLAAAALCSHPAVSQTPSLQDIAKAPGETLLEIAIYAAKQIVTLDPAAAEPKVHVGRASPQRIAPRRQPVRHARKVEAA